MQLFFRNVKAVGTYSYHSALNCCMHGIHTVDKMQIFLMVHKLPLYFKGLYA
jgi:hypothetical protein